MTSFRFFLNCFVFVICIQAKDKFKVEGLALDLEENGIKGASLYLINADKDTVEISESGRKGKFKFKKILEGEYVLRGISKENGSGGIKFKLKKDIDDLILRIKPKTDTIPKNNLPNLADNEQEFEKIPQQRTTSKKETLKFEKYFFEYDTNIKKLQLEIDSLKSVVKGYEKKQTMPNVSREILDLIQIPDYQHRIELQNGTIVSGALLDESDSTLIIKTQIGTLVLKKEMVIRMDEIKKPGPKVVFMGDPFIDFYPDRHIFSGKVKNIGEIRADFVRVIGNLFDQTTSNTGKDSVFVKGTRIVYESKVIADTALEPGEVASYSLTVPIKKGKRADYHTMDIHWEQTN